MNDKKKSAQQVWLKDLMHVKTFQLSSRIQQSAFSWFKSMLLVCSFLKITYKSIYSLTILEQFKKYLNVVLKIITKDFLNDALKNTLL